MIDIVLCTDENYAAYCAVVMVSALKNTEVPHLFRFNILTLGLNKETSDRLKKLVESYNANLNIIEVNTHDFEKVKTNLGRFGISALLRLNLDMYLSPECKRAIYLDCDLLILTDLKILWDIDIKDNTVGAIVDLCSPSEFLSRNKPYFNSGVLIINILKWRENKIGENSINYLSNLKEESKYPDQDALNSILSNDWESLNISFNMQPAAYTAYEKKYNHIPRKQIEEAVYYPNIVHFIGPVKPWHVNCTHPLQSLFLEFSNLTPWPISQKDLLTKMSWTKRIKRLFKHLKINKRRKLTKYQIK
ncbi:glycosyltransferase family 8 protein [Vibrio tritonius]|uniref:Glycosyltransferase family 8 protein n=1 Tax=Vibrio tritonius TaxID=1435069 RepID=A0ABS7YNJ6_9VIBR|nr:glycosyltransferase family 8 protein [Vibrio tritonius]MCA2016632.1 glycosyltransferase family 8 protein [Vibrio tritonius]